MTTEKKAVSKITSTLAVKSESDSKPTRQSSTPGKTVTKTPVKRVSTKVATTINKIEPIKKTIVKQTEPENKIKPNRTKMVRDSFTMPREEYAQLGKLKARLDEIGQPAKKSELLRAGVALLVAMTDARLKETMATIPLIKTGRPKKKK